MAVFNEPTKWKKQLVNSGDANTIPDDTTAGTGDFSFEEGFPQITQIPLGAGGIAPDRKDFNGVFKLLGAWIYYIQNGGSPTFSSSYDYVKGRVILYKDGNLYKCKQRCGASSTVVTPDSKLGSKYWSLLLTAEDIANIYATVTLDNVSNDSIFNLQNCDLSEQEITETLHNNIFRGHDLLNYFTNLNKLQNAVSSGDFSKIYIGDYVKQTITYSGTQYTTKYRVAGINTFKNYGDTALTRNHLVLIPDRLFDAQMNTSNTTSGGYVGSRMYTTVLPALLNALAGSSSTPFYGKIISHRELFANAENDWAWYDNSLCLLSEMEAYGSRILASYGHSIGFYAQMPLFKLNPDYISKFYRQNVWLRSVSSSTFFCVANGSGYAYHDVASNSRSVRPRFLFG